MHALYTHSPCYRVGRQLLIWDHTSIFLLLLILGLYYEENVHRKCIPGLEHRTFLFLLTALSLHCFLKYPAQSLLMSWMLFGWNQPTQDATFLSEMKGKANRTIIIFPFGFLSPSHSYFWKGDKDLNSSASLNCWKLFTCQELTLKDFQVKNKGWPDLVSACKLVDASRDCWWLWAISRMQNKSNWI